MGPTYPPAGDTSPQQRTAFWRLLAGLAAKQQRASAGTA
jgi:hypothetical protein